MQAWKKRLGAEFEELNMHAASNVEQLRNMLKSVLASTKCGKCGVETLDGDLVRFKCPGAQLDHVLCSDCLGDRIERQRGYLERHSNAAKLKQYTALQNLVLCFECHCPHIVASRRVFNTGFSQKQSRTRGRTEYSIDEAKTAAIQLPDMFRVESYYENQRRGMFSKFSCANLTFADSRSAYSSEAGEPVDLKAINYLCDRDFEWMEDWTCDTNSGDPQGWSYAVNWPTANFFSWSLSASFTTFVRRRRMLRTKIKLDGRLMDKAEASTSQFRAE